MADSKVVRILAVAAICSLIIYGHEFVSNSGGMSSVIGASSKLAAPEAGKKAVLVTGAAGFIGSHACLTLLEEGHSVLAVDNLSRGNRGAIVAVASSLSGAQQGRLLFLDLDLGDKAALQQVFSKNHIDLVMHFAAVAYVGESVAEPLRYYHNVTVNTVTLLETMSAAGVHELVYSSTCATYGGVPASEVPVTESTETRPNNPYGWSKWMAEQAINDYAKANPDTKVAILRYFNVYGSDPQGRIGEFPRPDLRHHGRISNACFDAALGNIDHLTIMGTNHPTPDGTCIRDYIHVTDLIDAHIKVTEHLANPPSLYNVGTGKGVSVKEFVDACIKVTGKNLRVQRQAEARPGDYPEMWAIPRKIQEEVGWTARFTDIEEGLAHAWQWRSRNPEGYRVPKLRTG